MTTKKLYLSNYPLNAILKQKVTDFLPFFKTFLELTIVSLFFTLSGLDNWTANFKTLPGIQDSVKTMNTLNNQAYWLIFPGHQKETNYEILYNFLTSNNVDGSSFVFFIIEL